MNYQALYRKYRPRQFEDVIGQNNIIEILKNSIKNNHINHAYLFVGPRGTGKTSVAKIFAKSVNCMENQKGFSCEKCEICEKYNKNKTIDVIEIDAASNNGVDEIREIRNNVTFLPTDGKYKIYIIDEVHMLSTGAFNALLKTLEEPPKHVIFILATTEPQKIPLTIMSRCQKLNFKLLSNEEIKEKIKNIAEKENIVITDEALIEISKIAEGSMRDAISLFDQLSSLKKEIQADDIYNVSGMINSVQVNEFLDHYFSKNEQKFFEKIDYFFENGYDIKKILESIQIFLRNYLFDKGKAENNKNLNKIAKKEIITFIEDINELNQKLKNNSQPKILTEMFFLKSIWNIEQNSEQESEPSKSDKPAVKEPKIMAEATGIERLKEIRINNTLIKANKTNFNNFKTNFVDVDKYLADKNFGVAAGILKDSQIRAVSDSNVLFTIKLKSTMDRSYKFLDIIEQLIELIYSKKYNLVFLTEDEWQNIRPVYAAKIKLNENLQLIDESIYLKKIKKDYGISDFEELIEEKR